MSELSSLRGSEGYGACDDADAPLWTLPPKWQVTASELCPWFMLPAVILLPQCGGSSSQAPYPSLPPGRRKLTHSAARPLRSRPASLGS